MNYKKIGIFFTVFFACLQVNAQNLTQSIYSQYGIGELFPIAFSQQNQIGGASVGLRSKTDYAIANPASYSALKYTVYNVGIRGVMSNIQTSTSNAKTAGFSYTHISMAFPLSIKRNFGASFGFLPYSAYGYSSSNTTDNGILKPYKNIMEGTGGINKFYMGTGFNLSKHLSIGGNASYLFGNNTNTRKINFDENDKVYNYKYEESRFTSGFVFDVGTQYQIYLQKIKFKTDTIWTKDNTVDYVKIDTLNTNRTRFILGGSYTLNSNLTTNSNIFARTYADLNGFDKDYDTAYFTAGEKGNISLPSKFNIGFSIGKENKWKIAGEYATQQWSNYKNNGKSLAFLVDDAQLSFGGTYIPEYSLDPYKNIFSHIEYRAGIRNYNSNLMLNGTRINEYAANFGIGVPFLSRASRNKRIEKFISYVNLGVEYGLKGTTNYGLAKENTFRFYFSLNLLDIWFDKYKYD